MFGFKQPEHFGYFQGLPNGHQFHSLGSLVGKEVYQHAPQQKPFPLITSTNHLLVRGSTMGSSSPN